MGSGALRALGVLLGGLGTAGTVTATAMPQWRVSAFIESKLIVLEDSWEGLWEHCSRQPDLRVLCQPYASVAAMAPALRAARGLMCAGTGLAMLGLLAAIVTGSCLTAQACSTAAAGLLFLLAAIVALIPLCWVASSIISDFYNPWLNAVQKRELGQALFVGWGSALCLLAAGAVF
ncbi:claudin-8-like, partial [Malurus melanocephalus]|uniref:claudin-8-like n=1 Tax=Malurus melanocephalus TaxID=175006 RepID=UPI0025468E07